MKRSGLQISIRNQTSEAVSLRLLKSDTKKILRALGWKTGAVDVLLVGDRTMRSIHRKFLGRAWTTDVISFGSREQGARSKGIKGDRSRFSFSPCPRPLAPGSLAGDIVISLDTTRRQAAQYGNPFYYELCFYICHGILHILGWNDSTKKKRDGMLHKQARILTKIGMSGTGTHEPGGRKGD